MIIMNSNQLTQMINSSNNIIFFGGAGVSTESLIPDFRSEIGLYKTINNNSYKPETMLSHSFFASHTEDFFNFYKSKMIYKDARPNAAHYALGKLERLGKLKAVITQNIDGLHQLAGSKNVLELHGSVHRNYCMKCKKDYSLDYILSSEAIIPTCEYCGGIVRPDVTLYEESLNMKVLSSAIDYIKKADMLIVGGTSLVVYPAAGLVQHYSGSKLVLINKSLTSYDNIANLVIHESIAQVLSEAIKGSC
jgi:NAD-dependent deacetylase